MKTTLLLTTLVLFKFSYCQFSLGIGYTSKMDDIFNRDKSEYYFKSTYYFHQYSINSSFQRKKLLVDFGMYYAYSNGVLKGIDVNENNSAYSSSSYTYYSSAKVHSDNIGFNLSISKMLGKKANFKHFIGFCFGANSAINIEESDHSKTLVTKWHWAYNNQENSGGETYPETHEVFDAADGRPINFSFGMCYKPRILIKSFFIQFNLGLSFSSQQSITNNIYNYYGSTDFHVPFRIIIPSLQFGSTFGYVFKMNKKEEVPLKN